MIYLDKTSRCIIYEVHRKISQLMKCLHPEKLDSITNGLKQK